MIIGDDTAPRGIQFISGWRAARFTIGAASMPYNDTQYKSTGSPGVYEVVFIIPPHNIQYNISINGVVKLKGRRQQKPLDIDGA